MGITRVVKKEGQGVALKPGDKITVHCTGYLVDGKKKFWSTKDDNKTFTFIVGVGQLIKGWDEGMLQMRVDEVADLLVTSDYAYGIRGFPAWNIPANADLLFEVEVLANTTKKYETDQIIY